jgi:hypothetical protein
MQARNGLGVGLADIARALLPQAVIGAAHHEARLQRRCVNECVEMIAVPSQDSVTAVTSCFNLSASYETVVKDGELKDLVARLAERVKTN